MKNFEKTSAQTPENATINPFLNAISKLPFAKQAMFIASFSALVGCGGEKGGDLPPEKPNQKPTATLASFEVNDATNMLKFDIDGTDPDGTIASYLANLIKEDGTAKKLTPDAQGKFEQEITTQGKYIRLEVKVIDNDGAESNKVSKTLNLTVEAPNIDSTIANPNPSVDENTTNDINLGIEDQNGVADVQFVDPNSDLAQFFTIVNNNTLRLRQGKTLNHETNPQITGEIKVIDNLGNEKIFTVTVEVNDVAEPQTIDVFGDGNTTLPNGEVYAIKKDEEKPGETLPIMYYNHGQARRNLATIQNWVDTSQFTYSDFEADIYNLYGTGIGPTFSNGQRMVNYDATTREVLILGENGETTAKIPYGIYGKSMSRIKDIVGTHNNIEFTQQGTGLHETWKDMIILQANNPTKLYQSVDRAIQNYQTK